MTERILILDFGSQVTQLIARRVREAGVYCEIRPRAAMGYTGCATLGEMQRNCKFVRVSLAGLRESHIHDVSIVREPPNYQPPH